MREAAPAVLPLRCPPAPPRTKPALIWVCEGAAVLILAVAALSGIHALGWIVAALVMAGAVVERVREGRGR